MIDHYLIARAEKICGTGQLIHDISSYLSIYRFCGRVAENKQYTEMNENEKTMWKELLPHYETAIRQIIATEGKTMPDMSQLFKDLKAKHQVIFK
jgi:hypothetical protein